MPFAPTYPTFALISDWHQPTAGPEADAHQRRACELIEDRAPAAVLCSGDALLNAEPYTLLDFLAGELTVPIYIAPGNHDTTSPPSVPYGTVADDPHAALKAAFPQIYGANDWGMLTIEGVRIYFCSNNSPHISSAGEDTYRNCNPPGNQTGNPERSGWSDPESDQRQWLNVACEAWAGQHVLLITHRPHYAPFSSDIRPLHPCVQALEIPVQASVGKTFLHLGADIHVASHCRVSAFGCEFSTLTLRGGYFNRAVDPIIETLWDAGTDHQHEVDVAFLSYEFGAAQLEVWTCSDEYPDGILAHSATILPVTGGAQ
ncbi:MAG: metallophosphoesterase [Candidatus Eisenbacteria bacterium]|uniref:Metallophosphoesterase n=1 Tax=Eiseniibacteriota bacterium TaxID=2212470 RepID=A0A956LVG2_UNCEI|nr:metallophosphoesterase [Candidatus Eisenbacteria bacterium]